MAPAPQEHAVLGPDARFKTDILVVVAHPDDEAAVTPYLARAIYDEHKHVAVVYGTRGGSGGNDNAREHGPALAEVREIEARQACAALDITHVWFLDGKDTASQDLLNSLANWGHGANLESLVRIVRLTRPEVILTWLPGVFIGENHGDHQAAGVLATEAFDAANDPVAFPAQLAGASKRLEPYLENLTLWQPRALYYFDDASDSKQFLGSGPAYSIRDVSPSQKKPYWRLAIDALLPYRTQFPGMIDTISKMNDAQLEKMIADPDQGWSEPQTLIYGRSATPQEKTQPLFPDESTSANASNTEATPAPQHTAAHESGEAEIELAGPWGYYQEFRAAHELKQVPVAATPEIAIEAGSVLFVPLELKQASGAAREVSISVQAPPGWKVISGDGNWKLPEEPAALIRVQVQTPALSGSELQAAKPQEVAVSAASGGKSLGEVRLRVLLRKSALPQ